jgi:hypothetical protein
MITLTNSRTKQITQAAAGKFLCAIAKTLAILRFQF